MTRTTVSAIVFFLLVFSLSLFLVTCRQQPETTPFGAAKLMVLNEDSASLAMALSTNRMLIAQEDPWDRSTLLHVACASFQDFGVVDTLLKAGANPNALDDVGRTPLHNAYIFSVSTKITAPIVDLLLDHGANLEIKDAYGKTPTDYRQER
jgi:hypothetical protein